MYYKTKLRGNFFYVLTVLSLTFLLESCTSNEIDSTSTEKIELKEQNERIDFETSQLFNKKIDELSNLNKEELEEWIRENNPNSLYDQLKGDPALNDEYLENLPDAYKAIFNSDSEIVISNKIIWLNKEKLYEFNISDDTKLLKNSLDKLKQIGLIKISFSDPKAISDNSLSNRVSIGQDQLEARYQYEYNNNSHHYNCSGTFIGGNNARLKYVHELMTVQSVVWSSAASKLYLRLKLEWKSRRRWKPASEPRDMNININLSGTYLRFSSGLVINTFGSNYVNLNYTCSGDKTILLKSSDSYGLQGGAPYWSVQSTGTITHRLHNASNNSWTNSFVY